LPRPCWKSEQAALPPYLFQALLRAEAPELATAIEFLRRRVIAGPSWYHNNDPIPMSMTRVHNVDRAQLLLESPRARRLQPSSRSGYGTARHEEPREWSLEVDPLDI
jgi:primosomal protein N' (replication factor Y)